MRDFGTGIDPVLSNSDERVVFDGLNRTLYIELSEAKGSVSLSLISIDGKLIYTFSESGVVNQFSHTLDLNSAENGVYICTLQYNERRTVHKLIIQ